MKQLSRTRQNKEGNMATQERGKTGRTKIALFCLTRFFPAPDGHVSIDPTRLHALVTKETKSIARKLEHQ